MLVFGREGGEFRKRSRHMWSVPSVSLPSPTTTLAPIVSVNGSSTTCLLKDGRKISVGDCALFKPAQDSPPFVGIIRSLIPDKESTLAFGVNWLYRRTEVKLIKGVALDAAPNEVFYSFHRDEIPAASLLHPCKVAFLSRGAQLPAGVSSFVCRRVYDITNKCLWWLTDQDFIDERQEEVNKLLNKTRMEMHASVEQQGPCSPKPPNGSAATSLKKHSPDSVQNSSSYLSFQAKGKKRDRQDHSSEPVKREPNTPTDDENSGQLRSEGLLSSEIAKMAENGGLSDSKAVARLLRLMQAHKSQKKVDLRARSMLAGIVAATDKLDCLSQFVQHKGLAVFDEWLQEVHKGKIGAFWNLKDIDKFVDDFLLVLLRALDKLPVNLNALQTSNIGKSVNHLRSHKNSEIQKKARCLVDTWKKRVEAEMNINDAKTGSPQAAQWPGRSRDGSDGIGGYRPSGRSSEAAVRSSVPHNSSLKSVTAKPAQGESKLAYQSDPRSAVSPISPTSNCKDGQFRMSANGGTSEPLQTVVKDEKSLGSSQSHTNTRCVTARIKCMVPGGKEDAERSMASPKSLHNSTASCSKHRKLANGHISVAHKETSSIISSSMARSLLVEKVSPNGLDSSVNVGNFSEGNNHKLIVKIPNRVRGPAPSIVAACAEDTCDRNSGVSSPVLPERHDQSDACLRVPQDSHKSYGVGGSSVAELQRPSDTGRLSNVSKAAYSPARNETLLKKVHDSSFSLMNALLESCAMFSEANVLMLAGDDDGINLLASVAVGEFSESDIGSAVVSPPKPLTTGEHSYINYSGNKKQLHGDTVIQQESLSAVGVADECNISSGVSNVNNGESSQYLGIANGDLLHKEAGCLGDDRVADEQTIVPCTEQRCAADVSAGSLYIKSGDTNYECHDQHLAASKSVGNDVDAEDKVKCAPLNLESKNTAHSDTLYPSMTVDIVKANAFVDPERNGAMEQKSCAVSSQSESRNTDEMPAISSRTSQHSVAGSATIKFEKTVAVELCDHDYEHPERKLARGNEPSQTQGNQEDLGVHCADVAMNTDCKADTLGNKEALVQQTRSSGVRGCSSAVFLTEDFQSNTKDNKLVAGQGENTTAAVNVASSPTAAGSDLDAKLGFDLNEGLYVDEGKHAEPLCVISGPCVTDNCPASSLQTPDSSALGGVTASITVAAAAKGPFIPSDGLLRNKRELRWKGSAATSAFRPAEPRKESPLGLGEAPCPDGAACKQARPPLDIDLNVADESFESNFRNDSLCQLTTRPSLYSSGGLDLDLNKADESSDMVQQSASSSANVEVSVSPVKALPCRIFSNGEASGKRDFDLNSGPAIEETPFEEISYSQPLRNNIPPQSVFGSKFKNSDAGNVFACNLPGMGYSVSVSPSVLPDREVFPIVGLGSGPHRVIGGPTSSLSFNADAYRGSVLPSSPAITFQSAPFQYPVFPFGNSFPLSTSALAGGQSGYMDLSASGRISAIPSQLVGNAAAAAAVSFQYPHAYVVSRPVLDVSNNGALDSNRRWGKQVLDLNSGPGGVDLEGRGGLMPAVSRQVSAIGPQLLTEEQARMYSMGGGILKRKEPEGGWITDKLNFKQSSWWK